MTKVRDTTRRNSAKPRNLNASSDPYWLAEDIGDHFGGRGGKRLHRSTIWRMVRDGRLPPPDLGGGGAPNRWRRSRILAAAKKLERRPV